MNCEGVRGGQVRVGGGVLTMGGGGGGDDRSHVPPLAALYSVVEFLFAIQIKTQFVERVDLKTNSQALNIVNLYTSKYLTFIMI